MLVGLLLSALFADSLAQVTISRYPSYKPVPNFQASEYEGAWKEIARIPNYFEVNEKCSLLDFSLNSNGSFTIDLISTNIDTGNIRDEIALAIPKRGSSAQFDFRFPPTGEAKKRTLYILGTDYQNYAVESLIEHREDSSYWQFAWILSREPTLSRKYYVRALNILRANGISPKVVSEFVDQKCDD